MNQVIAPYLPAGARSAARGEVGRVSLRAARFRVGRTLLGGTGLRAQSGLRECAEGVDRRKYGEHLHSLDTSGSARRGEEHRERTPNEVSRVP